MLHKYHDSGLGTLETVDGSARDRGGGAESADKTSTPGVIIF